MTSRCGHQDGLRGEFERVLNELALNGRHVPARHPFDWRVFGALEGICTAYPHATAQQLAEARLFFERQMHRWPAHRKRIAG